ncbi:MAG: hypothetical protein WC875_01670 [Candidatus Absconditabacterales bacterium]|jgi:hypothetical protein
MVMDRKSIFYLLNTEKWKRKPKSHALAPRKHAPVRNVIAIAIAAKAENAPAKSVNAAANVMRKKTNNQKS